MNDATVIGIDFGGTSVKLAAVAAGSLLGSIRRIPTQDFDEPGALIDRIAEEVAGLRESHPEVFAVGVGVPGAVNVETGYTYNLTNVRGWTAVPLRGLLAERIGLPVVIDNDANCMAYAEWSYGAAKGCRDAVCVTLGTGVGGGLILGGVLYRGSNFAAGEIGQMSIDLDGVPGPYGNTGALERYIGNRQIVESAADLYRRRGATAPDPLDPETLAAAALAGDPVAAEAWRDVARRLGFCLMSVVYLLNPEIIVVGGGVSEAGDLLFEPLRETLRATLTDECFEHLKIVPARFGNSAGILESSALAASLSAR